MNKYTKWYNQIIERAKHRDLDDYTESHHIIPESLGGSDAPENLVNLTAREHFLCHWLLVKTTTGEDHYKMLNALRMMRAEKQGQKRYKTKITARVYDRIKKEYAQLQSQRYSGENNPMYGDKFYRSDEGKKRQREAVMGEKNGSKKETARKKIADSKIGKARAPFTDDWLANMSKSKQGENNPNFGKKASDKTRKLQSLKATGRKQSAETIQKKADAVRGSKREKKLCPHCNQMIAVNTYARWHGANCRSLKEKK
jgi:hypothetical protein